MKAIRTIFSVLAVLIMIGLSVGGSAMAASTAKSLSTNFTLVNLGDTDANVVVSYVRTDGSTWAANPDQVSFTVKADGGQKILRQYDTNNGMTAGQGSVVVSSSQPLGAVVQILARNQVPTSGAYNGVTQGSNKYYLPLLQRRNTTGSGVVNSQLIIQNTESVDINVTVDFIKSDGTTTYSKPISGIKAGASYYYDLEPESNLPVAWVGSAVVTGGGTSKIAVVGNIFLGSDGLMTYNGFPQEETDSKWFIPLLTSRLGNGQSGSVAVQNLSGGDLPVGDVQLLCTKDPSSGGPTNLTITNTSIVKNNSAYYFNPVVDRVNFPTNWVGACVVSSLSAQKFVAFAQIRYTNGVGDAAAYEGIPASSSGTTLYVPLIIKRLSNGAATAVTIQNLNETTDASVTLTYTPSPDYVAGGGSAAPVVVGPLPILKGSSIIRSQRLVSGANSEPTLPTGWYGSLKVTSNTAIQAYIAITNLYPVGGDYLMAHIGFTK